MGITHATTATGTDSGTGEIHKAQWNADHVITGENFGFIGAKAYNSTTQNINNTTAALTFDSEEWDTDGFHSTVTNSSRMTVPAGLGGKYLLQAGSFASGATDYTFFRVDGTTTVRGATTFGRASATYHQIMAIVSLAAGQYVEAMIGNTTSINYGHASLLDAQSWFSLVKLDSGHVGQGVGASAYSTATQSCTGGQENYLTFNAEDYDTDGFHSTSVDTSRMTVPTGLGGKYLVVGSVYQASGVSFDFRIAKNRTTNYNDSWHTGTGGAGQTVVVLDLAAGDYVEASVWPGSTVTTGHATAREAMNSISIMRLDAPSMPVGVLRNTVLSPSSDTHIDKQAATTNYDSNTTLTIGNKWGTSDYTRFGLLTFDTAALAGRTVNSAFLQLVRTDSSALPVTFLQARRILRAYSPTQVTWNEYSTGNSWTTAGAESTGNDVAAGAYGDHQLQNTPGYATNFIRLDVTSLLQEDIDASSTTLRVILGMTNADGSINTITIASVNNATVAYRPKLFVAYA